MPTELPFGEISNISAPLVGSLLGVGPETAVSVRSVKLNRWLAGCRHQASGDGRGRGMAEGVAEGDGRGGGRGRGMAEGDGCYTAKHEVERD